MRSIAVLPALGLVGGAIAGATVSLPGSAAVALAVVVGVGWFAWLTRRPVLAIVAAVVGYVLAGAVLETRADVTARHTPLRGVLHRTFGGFDIDDPAAAGAHTPVLTYVRLTEDASLLDGNVRLRGMVERVVLGTEATVAPGGVLLTVPEGAALGRMSAWRAGRTLAMPVTFRRPPRFLTEGVGDGEAAAARDGISLLGRTKSGLLVEVVARGSRWEEWAAEIRSQVRRRVAAHMPRGDGVGAGIMTALLIGDRTAIPPAVRDTLQSAGTYHVIAISGGNVAIVAVLVAGLLRLIGLGPRGVAALTIPTLLAYALVVSGGPSVGRAVLMAVLYLSARVADLRTRSWNALAVSAGILMCVSPLDVRDAGFWLTYVATVALLGVAWAQPSGPRTVAWFRRVWEGLIGLLCTSMAVELMIVPVSVTVFGRVPLAGVAANLVAVPAMTVAQLAGLCAMPDVALPARTCGRVADLATRALLATSGLVDGVGWLAPRVAPPPVWVWPLIAAAAVCLWRSPRRRSLMWAAFLLVGVWANWHPHTSARPRGLLTVTALDVGQGEALLLRLPDGRTWMVDAGGAGGIESRVGERVVTPALWARGIHRLDGVIVTHADPDHVAGVPALLRDFRPPVLWSGIDVNGHAPSMLVWRAAEAAGVVREHLTLGSDVDGGAGVRIQVLHPAPAGWERRKVRNDDSVVIEVVFGDVSFLLTGDAGAGVEAEFAERLSPARVRVLKVGHHGSRGSTSPALLRRWPPQLAVISCGRGNGFGHPAPDVLDRLTAAGARILRTDLDGEVSVETDGRTVRFRTYRRPSWTNLPVRNETYAPLLPSY